MHLVFFMRGVVSQVEILKVWMQCQFWKWKRLNLVTNQYEEILCQGALRPSVLGAWEYVFPEECLEEVLSTFGIKGESYKFGRGNIEKIQLGFLRKIFGVEKIKKETYANASKIEPSIYFKDRWRGLAGMIVPGTAIHVIGIKRDDRRDFDFTAENGGKYNQEAL
jgi:hypothetical protein